MLIASFSTKEVDRVDSKALQAVFCLAHTRRDRNRGHPLPRDRPLDSRPTVAGVFGEDFV
jgi:hypothetical protein